MIGLSFHKPVVFIDLESTGVDTRQDRIVEIGIVKLYPDGREESLISLINPGVPIPSDATERHKITNEDVAGKPSFRDFSVRLFEFIKDCDVGGFAVKKFDLPLLEAEFQRVGLSYSFKERQIIDVMTIYHALEPRDLKAAYKKYCNKDLEVSHRAESDVRATIEILKSQLEKHDDLPKDILGLHEFCNPRNPDWVDSDGKFIWVGENIVINFSKNKGRTLGDMAKNEPGFLNWIINNDFSSEVRKIAGNALGGIFPKKQRS